MSRTPLLPAYRRTQERLGTDHIETAGVVNESVADNRDPGAIDLEQVEIVDLAAQAV